jgi:F-box protein 11
MTDTPKAFLSYAHADDDFLGGRIAALRDALQKAVRFETGEPFDVFLDKDGIGLGQDWQDRLDEALAGARFLIPILSPSYFASQACRDELRKFLDLEQRAKRKDLVLPILIKKFAKPQESDGSDVAELKRVALSRQYADWSEHIFEQLDQGAGLRRTRELAGQIVATMTRTTASPPPPPPPPPPPRSKPRLVPGRVPRHRGAVVPGAGGNPGRPISDGLAGHRGGPP